ncbi:hypothetical protein D9M71_297810 [compost metagenome]
MQANQHLIGHLLVAERLHDAGVVAGQVDHHVGTALQGRLDPQHPQAGVAVDLAGHARLAFPHRRLELEHDLVAPTVVGALDRRQVLGVQRRGHLDLVQGAQRHGQHNVVSFITDTVDFDGHAVLVLNDRRDRGVGLDGFQLLDQGLGQHRAATDQARGTQVAIGDATVDAALLREVQQRQARRFVVAGTDLLVDQLTGGGRQVLLVEPARHVDLIQRVQRVVGSRVQRVVDRARQIVHGLVETLERLGGGWLLGRQIGGGEILAIDQVAWGPHEFRGRRGAQLEVRDVLVQHRLGLVIADPLAGGHAGTAAQARLGFQQGDLPALALQLVRGSQARQAAADHDRGFILGQRRHAEQPQHHQRTGAQPTDRHSANSGITRGKQQFLRARRLKSREGYVSHQAPASYVDRPEQSSSFDTMGCPRGTHCIGLPDCLSAQVTDRLQESENGPE